LNLLKTTLGRDQMRSCNWEQTVMIKSTTFFVRH